MVTHGELTEKTWTDTITTIGIVRTMPSSWFYAVCLFPPKVCTHGMYVCRHLVARCCTTWSRRSSPPIGIGVLKNTRAATPRPLPFAPPCPCGPCTTLGRSRGRGRVVNVEAQAGEQFLGSGAVQPPSQRGRRLAPAAVTAVTVVRGLAATEECSPQGLRGGFLPACFARRQQQRGRLVGLD